MQYLLTQAEFDEVKNTVRKEVIRQLKREDKENWESAKDLIAAMKDYLGPEMRSIPPHRAEAMANSFVLFLTRVNFYPHRLTIDDVHKLMRK